MSSIDNFNAETYEKFGRSCRRSMGLFSSAFTVSRLYLAATHLLCVDIVFFSERCKRYQFKHIEALWYVPTKSWHFNTAVFVLFAIMASLGLFIPERVVQVFFGTMLILIIVALVVNIRRGESCRCYVRTAAHTDQLPPINRVKLAQAFFSRLGPLIEESQVDIATVTQAPPLASQTDDSAEEDSESEDDVLTEGGQLLVAEGEI